MLALLLLPLAACDKYAGDKSEIHALWDEWDRVNAEKDGAAALQVYSASTFEWYGALLKKAMDAPAKEVWSLSPTEMNEVLIIRHRGKRKDLKGLDGRGYVKHATSQGWYAGHEGTWAIKDIKVVSDWAEAKFVDAEWADAYRQQRVDELLSRRGRGRGGVDKPPEYTVKFVREGGRWRLDEVSMHQAWDDMIADFAKQERKSVRDILMLLEEEDSEQDVKMTVWEPMKK